MNKKNINMNVTCGTDITEISRIKDAMEIKQSGERFKTEIFTEKEIEYCESKRNAKYEHYAARFAAKEAIYKAISCLLEDKYEISWQNVEILNKEDGKPYVVFHDTKFEDRIKSIDISISHSKDNAVANVVVCYE